jgi:hypothetical protein
MTSLVQAPAYLKKSASPTVVLSMLLITDCISCIGATGTVSYAPSTSVGIGLRPWHPSARGGGSFSTRATGRAGGQADDGDRSRCVVDTEVKDERRRMLAADGEGCPRRALATRDGGHEDPKIDSMASPRVPLGGMSLSARCVHDGWRV